MANKKCSVQLELSEISLESFGELLEQCKTPCGDITQQFETEAGRLLESIGRMAGTEGNAREKALSDGRKAAAHCIIIIAQMWGCSADESIVDMFAPFVERKEPKP